MAPFDMQNALVEIGGKKLVPKTLHTEGIRLGESKPVPTWKPYLYWLLSQC